MVRQSKTRAGVALPVGMVAHLADRLAEEEARQEVRSHNGALPLALIVDEDTGLAFDEHKFRHTFADIRAVAAQATPVFEIDYLLPGRDMTDAKAFTVRMQDLTFMRLRHTAITRLAEADCDPQLISAISGHSLATVQHILERYMVRTAKMAKVAFGKRLHAEAEPEAIEQGSTPSSERVANS
ncbi:MAG: hypothetical protein WCI94_04750 [Rhodospirillales bacterium]